MRPAGTRFAWFGFMRKPASKQNVALDHVSIPVRRLAAARKFYEAALGAIGMKINMDVGGAFGMGSKKEKIFWISQKRGATGGAHHAFRVGSRADVDAFHSAGIAAGGKDHGAPGLRPDYGPNYYAAFVKDPEDNNIEVVCYQRGAGR
jgi:catechol 2,3-dioxygenase-like lactoylglutathione lyase family enzyme